jgi:hypothetical protein
LPGAPGPNQRGPGWGYQPGSGIDDFVVPGWHLVFVSPRPRPGLALSVVGAIQRAKHRLRRWQYLSTPMLEIAAGSLLIVLAIAALQ